MLAFGCKITTMKRLMKTRTLFLGAIVLFAGAIALEGCNKDENALIDPGYVNITINPNSPEYIELNNVGGWAYLYANPPSRGIIVYRFTQDEFKAYERTPTYKPEQCCTTTSTESCARIIVDDSGILAVDTCSGSEYLLLDGSVTKGPATIPLYAFKTVYDGNMLQIYN